MTPDRERREREILERLDAARAVLRPAVEASKHRRARGWSEPPAALEFRVSIEDSTRGFLASKALAAFVSLVWIIRQRVVLVSGDAIVISTSRGGLPLRRIRATDLAATESILGLYSTIQFDLRRLTAEDFRTKWVLGTSTASDARSWEADPRTPVRLIGGGLRVPEWNAGRRRR